MYFQPPYFLLLAGLLVALTSGAAFEATLKQMVEAWQANPETHSLENLQKSGVWFPYVGITLGVGLFLSSGMQIFGFPLELAVTFALPLTLGSALLVWSQLKSLLQQIERGGSRSLDLDPPERA